MSLSGLVLGIINIAIVVAILVLVGAVILMFAKWLGWPIDWNVQRLYLLVVALVALYMLVAILFGIPSIRVIGHAQTEGPRVVSARSLHLALPSSAMPGAT